MKLGAGSRLVLHLGILERPRETQSQTGLTRHQRRENIRGSFAVARPEEIAAREILLIDDVLRHRHHGVGMRSRIAPGGRIVYVATVARTLKADASGVDLLRAFAEDERTLAATG